MKIGDVYIIGQIGNAYNDDGSVKEKGVELIDVVSQIAELDDDVEIIHCHIDSPGGFVEAGEEIAEFFATQDNIVTIAENMCASIATVVHTSVPLQNRKIEKGCDYMIHNPWAGDQSGDAAAFQATADYLKEVELRMEKHYSQATGQDKEVLSSFMNKDTFMSEEQCLLFNFASEILPKNKVRAVALLYNKNNNMKKLFKARMASALAKLTGSETTIDVKALKETAIQSEANKDREFKALMIETDKGTIETPFDDLAEGDPVMIEGEAPENGTYTVSGGEILMVDGSTIGEGTTFEVMDGVITKITKADNGVEGQTKAIDEMNAEELKAALKVANEKNGSLESALQASEQEKEEMVSEIESAAQMRSTFTPPVTQANFRQKNNPAKPLVTKASMQERRNSYKSKR